MGIALTVVGSLIFLTGIILFIVGLLRSSWKRIITAIAVYVVGFVVLVAGIVMWIHATVEA